MTKLFRVLKSKYGSLMFRMGEGAYYVFQLLPKKNKVVATSFRGKKYGDNARYIVECLHEISPETEIVWLKDDRFSYSVPSYIRVVSFKNQLRKAFELSTAKVWVNTHRMESNIKKSNKQLFIETWHGGLGIKKIEGDVESLRNNKWDLKEMQNTVKMADLFISNSDHLTRIYRKAFQYRGKIWKIGYPKNDILFSPADYYKEKIHKTYNIEENVHIVLYAPTFRSYSDDMTRLEGPFSIELLKVTESLENVFGEKWCAMVRWHPATTLVMKDAKEVYGKEVIDVTDYPEMQELIMAADAFISDYSSGIFDAAIREIPCFTFATDFESYKAERGVYYEMEELPFPCAHNNEELIRNILSFNPEQYKKKWIQFQKTTGLYETGHASKDIASVISEYMRGNHRPFESIQSE